MKLIEGVTHIVSTKDMPREDWLEHRRAGIGGSDAPAILGFSRWSNQLKVFLEKTSPEVLEDSGESEAAYWGNILEDTVGQEAQKRLREEVDGVNVIEYPWLLGHPEHPFLLANVDRLVQHPELGLGGLECKTANQYFAKDWADDQVPEAYQIQCHHYMAVTGLPYWYIACLVGGQKFVGPFRIDRDDEIIKHIVAEEIAFWEMITAKEPPALDGSNVSSDILKALYPSDDGETVIDSEGAKTETVKSLISSRDTAISQIKEGEYDKAEAENKLKEIVGDAQHFFSGECQLTWKNVTRNTLDSKRLKAEEPDVYDKYVKSSTSRRFGVKVVEVDDD